MRTREHVRALSRAEVRNISQLDVVFGKLGVDHFECFFCSPKIQNDAGCVELLEWTVGCLESFGALRKKKHCGSGSCSIF